VRCCVFFYKKKNKKKRKEKKKVEKWKIKDVEVQSGNFGPTSRFDAYIEIRCWSWSPAKVTTNDYFLKRKKNKNKTKRKEKKTKSSSVSHLS
jgi:hypothetical protein